MKKTAMVTALITAFIAASAVSFAGPRSRQHSAAQIRVGGFFLEGGGEFWDESESVFTLRTEDFDGGVLGLSFVSSINNNLEVGVNADFFEESVPSAYSGFVDTAGFPIVHTARLQTTPLTVDVRLLPTGRHRIRGPRGHLVSKPVMYVGAGAGVNLWEYEEIGDFLDFGFDPAVIFFDRFRDRGAALEVHALGGVEFPIGPSFNLLFEGRYSWSDDTLSDDFAGLGRIELGGASAFAGASFHF